jgi:mRNA-degrading endonuclease toxin of MazEF toxin-antitoxin module
MNVRRGDVVLAEYPHSAGGSSLRPVLVIQSDAYNAKLDNTVVAQITSVLKHSGDQTNCLIEASSSEGRKAGLLRTSVVSCINLNTVHTKRIKRKIGELSPDLMRQISECLKAALEVS